MPHMNRNFIPAILKTSLCHRETKQLAQNTHIMQLGRLSKGFMRSVQRLQRNAIRDHVFPRRRPANCRKIGFRCFILIRAMTKRVSLLSAAQGDAAETISGHEWRPTDQPPEEDPDADAEVALILPSEGRTTLSNTKFKRNKILDFAGPVKNKIGIVVMIEIFCFTTFFTTVACIMLSTKITSYGFVKALLV